MKVTLLISTFIANLVILGSFMYVVFVLDHSAWWLLFPLLFHFNVKVGK